MTATTLTRPPSHRTRARVGGRANAATAVAFPQTWGPFRAPVRKRATLRVVPTRTRTRRRRRTVISACATVIALLTVVAFHALLAQSQIALDRLEQQTANAEQRYEEARYQRSLLASPERITKRAIEMGLILPGQPARVVVVDREDAPQPPDAPSGTFGGYTEVKSTLSTTP